MKPNKRKSAPPVFACLPRELLIDPPVGQLEPFDLAIACGLLACGRRMIDQARHEAALKAGSDLIANERALGANFKEEWKRKRRAKPGDEDYILPHRIHTYNVLGNSKPRDKTPEAIKKAGQFGYKRAKNSLRREAAPDQTISLSRSAILRLAGLSSDGKNLGKIDEALNRLTKNIRLPDGALAPLITSKTRKSDHFEIRLCGAWFDPPFGKVPLPIPTRSRAAAALYLFIAGIKTYASNRRASTFKSLCVRLGIPITGAGSVARRSIDRALDVVNSHVQRRLPIRKLAQHGIKIYTYRISKADESGASIKLETEKEVHPPKLDRVRKRVQPAQYEIRNLRDVVRYKELRERHLDGDLQASAILGLAPIEDE